MRLSLQSLILVFAIWLSTSLPVCAAEGINSVEGSALPIGAGDTTVMYVTPPTPSDGGLGSAVGVGTKTPLAKLDVNGGIRVGSVEKCTAQMGGTLSYRTLDATATTPTKSLCVCNGQTKEWDCMCPAFQHGSLLFSSNNSFKPPSGVSSRCPLTLRVLIVGGGASGAGFGYCAGNGSGRVAAQSITLTSSTAIPVTIGSGGVSSAAQSPGAPGGPSSFGTYLSADGANTFPAHNGGGGGSGGGPMCASINSFIQCPAGGSNGSNGVNGVKDAIGGGGWQGGSGQGAPIVSSPTTVMGLTFQYASFGAGAAGAGGMTQHDTSPWGYWQNYGAGGGAGGILISGISNPSGGAGQGGGGAGGAGFGAGGGGAGRPNAAWVYQGGAGAPGFVYVEW